MKGKIKNTLLCVAILSLVIGSVSLTAETKEKKETPAAAVSTKTKTHPLPAVFAEKPDLKYYPCSDCHNAGAGNPKKRNLVDEHDTIKLNHAEDTRWCMDCHDLAKRDYLRHADGEAIPFEKSFRLCGQCHGTIYRDWKAGIHGKRTGNWNGEKTYYLCVNCHDPHDPEFKPIKPEPPPLRPDEIKLTLKK